MSDSPDFTAQTLEETPARVAKFLLGIGAVATIRTQLAAAGMTSDDLLEGRKLLLACLAQPEGMAPIADSEDAKATRAAVAELDAWDEPNFARSPRELLDLTTRGDHHRHELLTDAEPTAPHCPEPHHS
jgi:hypothetical protein